VDCPAGEQFMHRFYLPPQLGDENRLQLEGREAHHALKVLRLQPGESVSVLDGAGHEFLCTIESVSRQALSLAVREKKFTHAPACPITLLVAVPKGKIIENIIQKSVELGAHRIVPLLTERVVMQLDDEGSEQKREKWQQVAVEAIKQCGAGWLPTIEAPQSIANFLAQGDPIELPLVGALASPRRHPQECFKEFQKQHGRHPRSAGFWIGPEGDFTPEELQVILESGALPVTLGSLTLRVETAAIYGLSILNYELGAGFC
jgi:16S rRNA (uracil1498-N3)-methyltransferase